MSGAAPAFARAAAANRAALERPWTLHAPGAPQAHAHAAPGRHGWIAALIIGVLMVLMIVPEGFDYSTLDAVEAPEAGSTISRLLWLGLLGAGSLVLVANLRATVLLLRELNPFLMLFVALVALSMTWSIEPTVTLRRLIRVATMVIDAGAFAVVGWHPRRFQSVVRPIVTAVLLGSLAFGLAAPALAIHSADAGIIAGAWHGLVNHKNGLGSLAAIGLILWAHAWLAREVHLLTALVGAGAAVACLVLSTSSTAMVAAVFTVLVMTALMRWPAAWHRGLPYAVTLLAAALLVYSMALLHLVPGFDALLGTINALTGKDGTLTGRTDIWALVRENINQHPWFGAGYGAFWTGATPGSPSYEFMTRMNFYPGSAHSGYLEVTNELGVAGLAVLLGYLATFLRQALHLLPHERAGATLFLALLLHQAVTNLAESNWFNVLSVNFVFMTLATTALARLRLEQRLAAPVSAASAVSAVVS